MFLLGIACIVLGVLSFAASIMGWALMLIRRGQTTVRKGPEIYTEMMMERMARDNRGSTPIAQAGIGLGTGIAWERKAGYSLEEVKLAVKQGRCGAILPVLLGMGGLLAAMLFGGASLALLTGGNGRFAGFVLLGMAVYGTYLIGKDYRATKV